MLKFCSTHLSFARYINDLSEPWSLYILLSIQIQNCFPCLFHGNPYVHADFRPVDHSQFVLLGVEVELANTWPRNFYLTFPKVTPFPHDQPPQ